MRYWCYFSSCFVLAASVIGCGDETVVSTDVSTLDMSVAVDATDEGKGVTVSLRLSSPVDRLRLTGGDTLKLRMGGQPLEVGEFVEDGLSVYLADVGSLSDDIIMDIIRPHDKSIEGFVIEVPPPILLSAEPVVGDFPLVLTWNGAPEEGHTLNLTILGSCTQGIWRNLPNDVGMYTVFQTELMPSGPGAPATCPLQVTLTRYRTDQGPLVPTSERIGFYSWITVGRSIEVSWTE
jgi:hypothetical protein